MVWAVATVFVGVSLLSGCFHRHSDTAAVGYHEGDTASEVVTAEHHLYRVALDIGHTPHAPGAIAADGTPEYEFNHNIVSLLAENLRKEPGVSPIIINPEGHEVSLEERSAEAASASADLLLAIHHDSANDRFLKPREVDGRTFLQTDKFHGFSVFFSRKNRRSQESQKFAELLGSAMCDEGFVPTLHHAEKIPGENRTLVSAQLGIYRFDDLVVLKTAVMPAVLLECGVIVNPSEEAALKSNRTKVKIVNAVTRAITRFAAPALAQSHG